MEVIQPENRYDITLGQYQRYVKFLSNESLTEIDILKNKLYIFLGIKNDVFEKIPHRVVIELSKDIDKALETSYEFQYRFDLNGVPFGFIPNFDKITPGEFNDSTLYPSDNPDTLHKLMAILFRPITKSNDLGEYKIMKYNGTDKYADIMKDMPLSVVDGAMVFFCNLMKELKISTQRYLREEHLKELTRLTTLKNGVGTRL